MEVVEVRHTVSSLDNALIKEQCNFMRKSPIQKYVHEPCVEMTMSDINVPH